MPWAFLTLGLVALLLSANVFWPLRRPAFMSPLSFFTGWLVGELALHALVFTAVTGCVMVIAGALNAWPGWVGLTATSLSTVGFWRAHREADGAVEDMRQALASVFGADAPEVTASFEPTCWRDHIRPFSPHRGDVVRVSDIAYAPDNGRQGLLDIYYGAASGCSHLKPADNEDLLPVFVYVHGGAWSISRKDHQGLGLLNLLASNGWLCVSINYRLSPRATFPDHLIDVKRALSWIKAHAVRYGGDPNFVVIGGGSAGAHLAALAALTPDDRGYQPGFESADTSVQGCVAFYGVFDLVDRHGHWPHPWMGFWLERLVVKQRMREAPAVFQAASPIEQLNPEAPPFLLIHGDRDSMVPVEESEAFRDAFKSSVGPRIALAKIRGAQHAFDIFLSRRSLLVNRAVLRYVEGIQRRHRPSAQRSAPPPLTLVRERREEPGLARLTLSGRGHG